MDYVVQCNNDSSSGGKIIVQCPPFALIEVRDLYDLYGKCLDHLLDNEAILGLCKIVNISQYTEACSSFASNAAPVRHLVNRIGIGRSSSTSKSSIDNDRNGDGDDDYLISLSLGSVTEELLNHTILMTHLLLSTTLLSKVKAADCWRVVNGFRRHVNIELLSSATISEDGISDVATPDRSSARVLEELVITQAKALFDASQLSYLAAMAQNGELYVWPESSRAELRTHKRLAAYLSDLNTSAHAFLYDQVLPSFVDNPLALLKLPHYPAYYNKIVYQRPFPSAQHPVWGPSSSTTTDTDIDTSAPVFKLLNPLARASKDYGAWENNMLVVDDLLRTEVLKELRLFCMQSTIWHAPKSYYVGAYMHEGFSHPLLHGIVAELRLMFPIVADMELVQMWAYNFSPEFDRGIGKHADIARVNMNMWLTNDEANLDPSSGGLVIYTVPPQEQDGFEEMQSEEHGASFLKGKEHLNVTVPYRSNRIVIFQSNLWHETDTVRFKSDFESRRINLTFLFGRK